MSTGKRYLSLLWPNGRTSSRIADQTWIDLGLGRVVDALSSEPSRSDAIAAIVRELPIDRETISYRCAITADLLTDDTIGDCFCDLVPIVEQLRYYTFRPDRYDWTPLQEVTWRVRELEHYLALIELLHNAFGESATGPTADGLLALRSVVNASRATPIFARVRTELPSLLQAIANFRSIAVGINLSGGLEPIEATLLAVGDTPYRGSGLAGRLLADSEQIGIAQLHSAIGGGRAADPLLVPLFKDLSEIMQKATRPLAAALREFSGFNTRNLVAIADELLFYSGVVRLARRLGASGLQVTVPELSDHPEAPAPVVRTTALYNVDLAVRRLAGADQRAGGDSKGSDSVVSSSVRLSPGTQIAIVTGPNGGGKTTFLQSVGIAQIMGQIAGFVPAERHELTPVDQILTHYPALERMQDESGRFGEEASRLRNLIELAGSSTLVLLNETLSSTAMGEAVYIARDVLATLRERGARVVFVTHLHDLASDLASGTESLVAQTTGTLEGIRPTYVVVRGVPDGKSYAAALAARHGLGMSGLNATRQA